MKFFNFSELGSCCRPHAPPPPLPEEEEKIGTQVANNSSGRRNGRCLTSTKSEPAAHWRPALQAISEDGVVASAAAAAGATKTKPTAQKKPSIKADSMAKPRRRSYSEGSKESRTNSTPVVIPAFSPTPFVF